MNGFSSYESGKDTISKAETKERSFHFHFFFLARNSWTRNCLYNISDKISTIMNFFWVKRRHLSIWWLVGQRIIINGKRVLDVFPPVIAQWNDFGINAHVSSFVLSYCHPHHDCYSWYEIRILRILSWFQCICVCVCVLLVDGIVVISFFIFFHSLLYWFSFSLWQLLN